MCDPSSPKSPRPLTPKRILFKSSESFDDDAEEPSPKVPRPLAPKCSPVKPASTVSETDSLAAAYGKMPVAAGSGAQGRAAEKISGKKKGKKGKGKGKGKGNCKGKGNGEAISKVKGQGKGKGQSKNKGQSKSKNTKSGAVKDS